MTQTVTLWLHFELFHLQNYI